MSTASSGGRKRPRSGKSEAVDLPRIPGVPTDLIPLLVEALKATRKVFHKDKTGAVVDPFRLDDADNEQVDQQQVAPPASALNNVLNRMEQSNVDQAAVKKEKQRYRRMLESQQQFFSALARLGGSHRSNHHSNSQGQQQQQPQPLPKKSIPLACFHYTWKLQEHKLMDVRRGSLNFCSKLLARDDHVRDVWTSNLMLEWLQSVVTARNDGMMLWQSEAKWVLQGMADTYEAEPRFTVGLRLLQQRCPQTLDVGGDATNASPMAQLRVDRDFAMLHGNKECEIVEKLIERANTCLFVLVPRMGQEPEEGAPAAEGDDDEDDDDLDDDIDWEEGDEQDAREAHASAVEQTLAMMQATGRLKGGDLEVSLNQEGTEDNVLASSSAATPSTTVNNERLDNARTKLGKVSGPLSTRHMRRLTSWLHALSSADHLVQQPGSSSLVAMSPDQTRQRRELRNRLLHLKTEVSSVLASTNKLSIAPPDDTASTAPEVRTTTLLTNVPRRHENLTRAIQRRRVERAGGTARQRSNRIQVKYRK